MIGCKATWNLKSRYLKSSLTWLGRSVRKRLCWGPLNWAEIQNRSGTREACSRQESRQSVQGPITGRTGYLKVPFFLRFSLIYWAGNTQVGKKSKIRKGTEWKKSPFLLWLSRDSNCLQALLILLELLLDTSTNVPFSCLYKVAAPCTPCSILLYSPQGGSCSTFRATLPFF